ncbi:hypothetical protein EDB86DRAFT_3089733 [Lactarius hatsudake]|nr:hypothetical protein EDB86DRAFT_3089733 [Lactarius hatsudake]
MGLDPMVVGIIDKSDKVYACPLYAAPRYHYGGKPIYQNEDMVLFTEGFEDRARHLNQQIDDLIAAVGEIQGKVSASRRRLEMANALERIEEEARTMVDYELTKKKTCRGQQGAAQTCFMTDVKIPTSLLSSFYPFFYFSALMANYMLYYFAEGKEAPGGIIISKSATVLKLRRAIHEECSPIFWDGARAGQLVLLKVDIEPTPDINIQDLLGDRGVMMNLGQCIDIIWPDQLNKLHLQISIHPPKHPTPEPLDIHSQLKHTGLATQAPSILVSSKNYASLQQYSQERILDNCPKPDLGIPPIPLLYSSFRHFLDIMAGHDDVPGITDIKVAQLQKAVDSFATKMTMLIKTEEDWMSRLPQTFA